MNDNERNKHKTWYLKNRESVLKKLKEYRINNRVKIKEYFDKTKEHRKENMRLWYLKNRESVLKNRKEYRKNNQIKINKYLNENKERINSNSRKYYKENKKDLYIYKRNYLLKKKYGIDFKEKLCIYSNQMKKCLICNKEYPINKLMVDHCHNSNKIRGLLCRKCNLAIGCFYDDIKILNRAIVYLGGDN